MAKKVIPSFTPQNKAAWRAWLKKHGQSETAVWLILYKVKSDTPSISWSEAVDEALCFGWIDSVKHTIDDEKYKQYFSPRKPKSTWSKVNKEKVKDFIEAGLMTPTGLKCIEVAKANGSWNILDSVDDMIVPDDLEAAFKQHPGAKAFYLSCSNSVKKIMLAWIIFAKRPETRAKRIREVAEQGALGKKPKHF